MSRLEYLRRKQVLSQQQLAAAILYSRYAISFLEHQRPASESVGVRLKDAVERYFHEPFEELMKDA